MSLREWLIAIGTLVILGIVIDGLRRMRRARKESMAISSGMGANDLQDSPLDEDYNPELPNGGARTISRETLEERGYVKKAAKSRFAAPEPKPTRPVVSAETEREPPVEEVHESFDEPAFSEDAGWGALDNEPDNELGIEAGDEGIVGEPRVIKPAEDLKPRQEPEDESGIEALAPDQTTDVEQDTAARSRIDDQQNQPPAGANRPEAQEVIVINVLAKQGQDFPGRALKQLFEACGLLYGDMDIYHRHEEFDTVSPVQFSVANAVEPGTFRPDDIETLTTPGISFFMSVPGPSNSMQAFDFMLETAQCVVRNMGGELKDERRSVMTAQTIEHCRQRIREYERKRRSPRQ
ncbi:cell division protein ZipA [Marinobacter zhejiangensis]|uniref:Cell division protein ZipA n=1 Tax=Marinobacter zhejiangensis TaxID=488535 RepID=A0A1I4PBC2_9GAMM|nr:cell division protein ZipA [Marinobacter zhejiangensis]SFM25051.1 cell division protein ZipA [Marinobacter zhejiangensis]